MVVQHKKSKFFVTGEVFLLDIGLLMGAIRSSSFQTGVYRFFDSVILNFLTFHYCLTMVVALKFSGEITPPIYRHTK